MQIGPTFAALFAAVLAVAPANAPGPALDTANVGQAQKQQRLICETEVPLGSRLGGHKICRTPEAIAARRLQEQQLLDRAQAAPCLPTRSEGGVAAC